MAIPEQTYSTGIHQVRKRHFFRHLYIKVIFLPRQARDKHRENSKKARFLTDVRAMRVRHVIRSSQLSIVNCACILLDIYIVATRSMQCIRQIWSFYCASFLEYLRLVRFTKTGFVTVLDKRRFVRPDRVPAVDLNGLRRNLYICAAENSQPFSLNCSEIDLPPSVAAAPTGAKHPTKSMTAAFDRHVQIADRLCPGRLRTRTRAVETR